MVSKAEAARALQEDGDGRKVRASMLVPGPYAFDGDGQSIPANRGVEVAYAEVGESTTNGGVTKEALLDTVAVLFGQRPDDQLRTSQGKATGDLRDDTDTALPDDLEFKIGARKRNESGMQIELSEWIEHGDLADANGYLFEPREPFIREARVITVHLRYHDSSVVYHHGNSSFAFPALQAK